MIRGESAPLNAVQLEASISDMRVQIGALNRRLPDLDEAIEATRTLLSEAEERLQIQEGEVCRLQLATGKAMTFGRADRQRTVLWSSGGKTTQLDGAAPADSPEGRAEQARRVYEALESEAAPIRAALVNLEGERADVARAIGLLEGQIEARERQLGQFRTAELEHERLTGRLGWQERLSAILRKAGGRPA